MPEYITLQKDYAKYRLDKLKENLEAAQLLLFSGQHLLFEMRPITMICLLQVKEETVEQIANAEWVYKMISD